MTSLRHQLKRERELRGISLRSIADETKITVRFLQAIEDGRMDLIPGEFYRRSYLRAYARYLGLDETRAMNDYRYATQANEPVTETQTEHVASDPVESSDGTSVSLGQWAAIVAVVVVVFAG